MNSETVTFGPALLSADEIRRGNEKRAEAWKWSRWGGIFWIGSAILLEVEMCWHRHDTLIFIVLPPTVLLLVAMFLIKPYRWIEEVECNYTLSPTLLILESRINGRRPRRQNVRKGEVVKVEEEGNDILLHLLSGDRPKVFGECFATPEERDLFLRRIRGTSQT